MGPQAGEIIKASGEIDDPGVVSTPDMNKDSRYMTCYPVIARVDDCGNKEKLTFSTLFRGE